MKKKLVLWHSDCEWVVAESPADATRVLAETHGGAINDFDCEDIEWKPWGEDKSLTISSDDDTKTVLTGAEWAARGRAYIGSTEY